MISSTFVFTAFLAVASAQLNSRASVAPPFPEPTSSGSVAPPFPDPTTSAPQPDPTNFHECAIDQCVMQMNQARAAPSLCSAILNAPSGELPTSVLPMIPTIVPACAEYSSINQFYRISSACECYIPYHSATSTSSPASSLTSSSTVSTSTSTNTPITYTTTTTYIPSTKPTSTANTTTSTLPSCIKGYTLTTIIRNATTVTKAVYCTSAPSTPVEPTITFITPTTYIPSTMATVTFVPRPSGSGSPVPSGNGNGNGNGNGTVTTVIPGAKTTTAPIVPVGPTTALAAPFTGAAASAIHMPSQLAAFAVVAAGLLLL